MKILITEKSLKAVKQSYLKKLKSYIPKKDIKSIEVILNRLKVMPKGKQKHSIRVSKSLVDFDSSVDVILGALFHDYIERGGNIDKLPISQTSKDIVRFLSAFDSSLTDVDNAPLHHLQLIFKDIENQELKNKLVLVKISDRLDNIKRRGKKISKDYLNKSKDLFRFLMSQYNGSIDIGNIIGSIKNLKI